MTPTHCPSCGHDPIRIISMTDMMKRPNAVNANMFLASGALGYLECEKCENENSTRAGKWRRFDKNRELRSGHTLPPAFIQSTADGLWAVQNLCTPPLVTYGKFTRLCQDPPLCDPSEPYYSGWPGDHRGWMRFASLVEARDYYPPLASWRMFESGARAKMSGKPRRHTDDRVSGTTFQMKS